MGSFVQSRWLPGRRVWRALLAGLVAALASACGDEPAPGGDGASPGFRHAAVPAASRQGVVRTSHYVPMRDGTRIAIDVQLPADLADGERLPTLLHQSRYWRSMVLRWPLSEFAEPPDPGAPFVAHGFAYVSADVRGAGASFGSREHPWSRTEAADASELVDWIVAQPWSNGRVGSMGVSYNGTAAEMLVTALNPAVKASAPLFSAFDAYEDVAFPGGVPLSWFLDVWQEANTSLDRGELPSVAGFLPRLLVQGVRPVGPDPALLEAAIAEHRANANVKQAAASGAYRDDTLPDGIHTVAWISPVGYVAELERARAPLYSWSGWMDGGFTLSAVKRFRTLDIPGSRLILGPWSHGGKVSLSPTSAGPTSFDSEVERVSFFDGPLRGDGPEAARHPVRYYTMVADRWNLTDTWPPPAVTRILHLGPDGTLVADAPRGDVAYDEYEVDLSAGTGSQSRWDTLLTEGPAIYDDRAGRDEALLVYESEPLATAMEVTGHPVVILHVASSATDGAFFAYLEDVAPDGAVSYVTEGMLRALHRKLSKAKSPLAGIVPIHSYLRDDAAPLAPGEVAELRFGLIPTSYVFRAGHRVRLALAGADADHFAAIPEGEAPHWRVHRDGLRASRLELPVPTRAKQRETPP